MLQTQRGSLPAWKAIVRQVRAMQPHVVFSGEGYYSWAQMLEADADIGGQGNGQYHAVMQRAVLEGDASGLEGVASTSGADAATVVCYLDAGYDGVQPVRANTYPNATA